MNRRMMPARLFVVAVAVTTAAALLTACAGSQPLPDEHYYRLSATPPPQVFANVLTPGVVVVEPFRAPGVYSERPVVYSDDTAHLSLEHYHYHFWIDAPPRLLQDELISYLRTARLATTVTAEAGRASPDYRVSGAVRRFERVKTADGGWQAAVSLELRVDTSSFAPPIFVRDYEQIESAKADGMKGSVEAFSTATAAIFQRFVQDFAKAIQQPEPATPKASQDIPAS